MSALLEAYAARAIEEATESGMARRELLATLDDLSITDLIPPHVGEPIANCAVRATSELMIRYLAKDEDPSVPPI